MIYLFRTYAMTDVHGGLLYGKAYLLTGPKHFYHVPGTYTYTKRKIKITTKDKVSTAVMKYYYRNDVCSGASGGDAAWKASVANTSRGATNSCTMYAL